MQKKPQYLDMNYKNSIKDGVFTPIWGVTLKDGLFKTMFDNNISFLKTFDLDAMLYWFRKRAGKPAPGEPYRGHFEDNIKGQTAGMFLMGAGNSLMWKEDQDLRTILDEIVNCIDECREPDGYLMAVSKTEFGTLEYPHYVRIWLNYGLKAAGMAGNPKAFTMLREWQDWFNRCDDLPIIKYLVLSFQGIVASTSVYNTPVGKKDDIDIAVKYYEEDWRLGQFINKDKDAIHIRRQPGHEPHPHGTELESFEGYLDLYRATGKHYYLRAVMNAYSMYKDDWQHPGGGIVMCEFLDAYPKCYWISPKKPYNELCCTSFWIQLNQRLHRLFPDEERYVAEIESSIYNICAANQDGTEGIRYFAYLDQHKQKSGKVTCCCGVGTKLYGSLPEFLYSVFEDGIYVDIYAASRFEWEKGDNTVAIDVDTKMPYNGGVRIKVNPTFPEKFSLKLRIPGWAASDVRIDINRMESYIGRPGTYCEISRKWEKDDAVSFNLPMTLKISRYTGAECVEKFDRYSFEYGPVLLAVKGEMDYSNYIEIQQDIDKYKQWLEKADEALSFKIKNKPEHEMVPYFSLRDETFTCFPLFRKKQENFSNQILSTGSKKDGENDNCRT